MPSIQTCPAPPGHHSYSRVSASASCLIFTIMSANIAAARGTASLPYLPHAVPLALRFANALPKLPPPPPLGQRAHVDTEIDAAAPPDFTNPTITHAASTAPPTLTDPAATDSSHSSQPSATESTSGVQLVPDTYARPVPVSVQDLLPYFVPPSRPLSQATYELK